MKNILIFVIIISITSTLLWFNHSDKLKESPVEVKTTQGIKSVTIEFDDRKIYLDVLSDEIFTCNDVFRALDISPIIIKKRTYAPTCIVINDELIHIVYNEITAI